MNTAKTVHCYTVGSLIDVLSTVDREWKIKLEVSAFVANGIQISLRENLLSATIAHNRIVLKAQNREGWQVGEQE